MSTHVTVPPVAPRIQYVADGVQTDFPFPFVIFKPGDLQVFVGAEVRDGGYTVTGAGAAAGGTVRFTAAPAAGALVTLRRNLTMARTSDFQEGGAFRAKVINDELDFQAAALQQVEADLRRAVALSPTATLETAPTLPPPAAGHAIGWSEDGTHLVNDPTNLAATIARIERWADDADASAQEVLAAAQVAATSATVAETAQGAAVSSAAAAARSEGNAAASATGARAAQGEANGHSHAAAWAAFVTKADRDRAIADATAAAASAEAAAASAAAALGRAETIDQALWRVDRAARRAEAAAAALSAAIPAAGIAPHAVLPNWARISS